MNIVENEHILVEVGPVTKDDRTQTKQTNQVCWLNKCLLFATKKRLVCTMGRNKLIKFEAA